VVERLFQIYKINNTITIPLLKLAFIKIKGFVKIHPLISVESATAAVLNDQAQ
jgi:hypothetical protein